MALRAAILRHLRVPVKTLTLTGRKSQPWGSYGASLRFLSSHGDDHLSKDEVIERVLSVIKSFPKVDPSQFILHLQVTPDVHFQKDLGLDSLDNVEIVMALEEEFKLEIPDKEADKIDSCNLAIEYIYNHPMAG
ncbi:acyl carrier protein 1, mitochondrial isoform X1 [Quercus robur]|uniref:acyl carrier protein 1, mitochondrial isoform X1 n=1 Tax=Quercus robur TaxID=38942 RepID=UPI00216192A2|nr:acyl carrier protein 1, mitochondrial isoform X1 [Quercus robur]